MQNMDALPEPDYGDFFAAVHEFDVPATVRNKSISIPFETARGCWWGEKHHCTFCGLNGLGMGFRSKSPDRALQGIDELADRYSIYQLVAVDNIMDLRYVENVFGRLAQRRLDYTFFYETKANLSHEQLKQLERGGIRHLQPGLESLSSNILKLMRKGTTAIRNVCVLKWGRYYGIHMHWNVLLGFPGETAEDYEQQAAMMRLIPHLQPPSSIGRIWLERFSPYYMQQSQFGFTNVRPEPAYAHIYPQSVDLNRIAYFFSYDCAQALPMAAHKKIVDYIESWKERWRSDDPPFLVYQRGAGHLTITDGREPGGPRIHSFGEVEAMIYEHCAPTARGVAQILSSLRDVPDADVSQRRVEDALDEFKSHGLMLEESGLYLSLAMPVNPNW